VTRTSRKGGRRNRDVVVIGETGTPSWRYTQFTCGEDRSGFDLAIPAESLAKTGRIGLLESAVAASSARLDGAGAAGDEDGEIPDRVIRGATPSDLGKETIAEFTAWIKSCARL